MKHSVELDQEMEGKLNEWSQRLGSRSEEVATQLITIILKNFDAVLRNTNDELVLRHGDKVMVLEMKQTSNEHPIMTTPGVMGGDACIRRTRIPVWAIVGYKKDGLGDAEILANFPQLSAADLVAAWDYYAAHSEQVDAERRRHEEAG